MFKREVNFRFAIVQLPVAKLGKLKAAISKPIINTLPFHASRAMGPHTWPASRNLDTAALPDTKDAVLPVGSVLF